MTVTWAETKAAFEQARRDRPSESWGESRARYAAARRHYPSDHELLRRLETELAEYAGQGHLPGIDTIAGREPGLLDVACQRCEAVPGEPCRSSHQPTVRNGHLARRKRHAYAVSVHRAAS